MGAGAAALNGFIAGIDEAEMAPARQAGPSSPAGDGGRLEPDRRYGLVIHSTL